MQNGAQAEHGERRRAAPLFQRVEMACAAALLVAIVVLVGIASVTRYLGSPIIWSVEIAQLLFVWLCMLAADLGLQQGRHFGLSVIQDRLSPEARRRVEIVNMAIVALLLAFLLVHAVKNTILMHPRLIGATQMHASLIHASMVLGLGLMLRTLATQLYRRLAAREAG
ncbi:MAG: TRAP transporter small permease [Alphaproteobacteria bacterium]